MFGKTRAQQWSEEQTMMQPTVVAHDSVKALSDVIALVKDEAAYAERIAELDRKLSEVRERSSELDRKTAETDDHLDEVEQKIATARANFDKHEIERTAQLTKREAELAAEAKANAQLKAEAEALMAKAKEMDAAIRRRINAFDSAA
jgi:chromosome segregation ATPase